MKSLKAAGVANLPTGFGEFKIMSLDSEGEPLEDIVIMKGTVAGKHGVPVRVQSECVTGEVFGSLRCDCREQLEKSLIFIQERGQGILIYLRQEGRGIGVRDKVKAYALQDSGADTIEANNLLGYPADLRTYERVVEVLDLLDIPSIQLLTNSPDKENQLKNLGVVIESIIPVIPTENAHNRVYLETKRKKFGHKI